METINGTPVTEEQIQAWADEAEKGYSVDRFKKRGRPSLGGAPASVIPVRMEEELLAALLHKAKVEHLNRSEAIRAAVQAWVDA
ncbi:ribbon-helix-helix domain-containing protein [Rothia nasisuis]|uniref:ribbon-helix-helix domain-containing protein n=1 Tax=Rothia nasisuis TaxID=2109647 RepID=UPI001F316DAD|nr:ribbon-helix-helix domain-containing protein [Rothia nasisuis]